MANTINKQTLVSGDRNLVVKVDITGDGVADETNTLLIDASAYNATEVKIVGIRSTLSGFKADLIWDATANVTCINLPDYFFEADKDDMGFGGLVNNSGAGKTGDILISTIGLGAAESGTIVLEMQKRG